MVGLLINPLYSVHLCHCCMHRISQSERNTIWLNNKTTIEKQQQLGIDSYTIDNTLHAEYRHTLSATK